jgi:1-acyl-sn-glycerol-3-phosphate acyltransferase
VGKIRIAGIVLATAVFSLLAFVGVLDRSFTVYRGLEIAWSRIVLWIAGVRVIRVGGEGLDPKKPYVFVSNHASLFDIPAFKAVVGRRADIVFKRELGRIPFFGWQLLLGPYIVIDRSAAEKALRSIEKAKRVMERKGASALIFAEGTRSKTGEIQSFKRGAFHLAARSGAPVVPTTIIGTNALLPKGTTNLRGGDVTVVFGEPIDSANVADRKGEVELMNRVREVIVKTKEERS